MIILAIVRDKLRMHLKELADSGWHWLSKTFLLKD